LGKAGHTFAEACCVFVGYREDANATLGAARFADQVMTAALVGVGYGGVYDLDEAITHLSQIDLSSHSRPSFLSVFAPFGKSWIATLEEEG
jgi:hypothetical protein